VFIGRCPVSAPQIDAAQANVLEKLGVLSNTLHLKGTVPIAGRQQDQLCIQELAGTGQQCGDSGRRRGRNKPGIRIR